MVKTQFVHQTVPVQGSQKALILWHLCKSQTFNEVSDCHTHRKDHNETKKASQMQLRKKKTLNATYTSYS